MADQVDAERWYLSAAELGDRSAWDKLGELYLKGGGGVRIDYAKARYWLRKAAGTGNPRAMYYLGTIYAEALGTGYDWPRARHWLEQAIRRGYAPAAAYLRQHDPDTRAFPPRF